MSTRRVEDYLARGEELLLSWRADSVERGGGGNNSLDLGGGKSEFAFGATDRRIVYLSNDGSFKDMDYNHISSIETDTEPNHPTTANGVGCCGGILVVIGFTMISDDPGPAFVWFGFGITLLVAAYFLSKNHDDTEKQKVKLITGDEAHQQLEMTTPENVGADLSRIVREQK